MPINRLKEMEGLRQLLFPTKADSISQGLLPRASSPRASAAPTAKERARKNLATLDNPTLSDSLNAYSPNEMLSIRKLQGGLPEEPAATNKPTAAGQYGESLERIRGGIGDAADSVKVGIKKIPTPRAPAGPEDIDKTYKADRNALIKELSGLKKTIKGEEAIAAGYDSENPRDISIYDDKFVRTLVNNLEIGKPLTVADMKLLSDPDNEYFTNQVRSLIGKYPSKFESTSKKPTRKKISGF